VLASAELPRAIDLGCGAGANAVFLAQHGFEVTGVDFSSVALGKARAAAAAAGVADRCQLVEADLTAASIPGVRGPFDLVVDYGTLDDLRGRARWAMADLIRRLSADGTRFLLWCFQAPRHELPWISFSGPSRLAPGLEPGEGQRLFGDWFAVERLPEPPQGSGFACYLLTRGTPAPAQTP
jgi:SAM-dependent methyltransferase